MPNITYHGGPMCPLAAHIYGQRLAAQAAARAAKAQAVTPQPARAKRRWVLHVTQAGHATLVAGLNNPTRHP